MWRTQWRVQVVMMSKGKFQLHVPTSGGHLAFYAVTAQLRTSLLWKWDTAIHTILREKISYQYLNLIFGYHIPSHKSWSAPHYWISIYWVVLENVTIDISLYVHTRSKVIVYFFFKAELNSQIRSRDSESRSTYFIWIFLVDK